LATLVKPIEERRLAGIALVIAAYLMFTVIDSCAKWLSQSGMPVGEVVFVRYAGQLILVSAFFLPTRGRELVRTRRPWLEVVRGLCLLLSTAFNFTAILFLPLTVTSSIMFTVPLLICALSIPILGESVGWRRWLAIVIGFVGILIVVQPGTAAFHPAAILSLASSLSAAFYYLLTRKLAGVDSVTTQQFYAALVATICVLPFVIGSGQWTWPTDGAGWLAFIAIGSAALLGHQFVTTAHRFAPASVLAPFGYVQIIFMTASSWLIFGQPPDVWIYVGEPIVIASGLYIWLRERQLSRTVVTGVTGQD
jgi:drug/metabolite transporter (DMT)-like permease